MQVLEVESRKEPGKQVKHTALLLDWQVMHRLETLQAIHIPE